MARSGHLLERERNPVTINANKAKEVSVEVNLCYDSQYQIRERQSES